MFTDFCNKELTALICGRLIGRGSQRAVYECLLRPDYVVKVEEGGRSFQNIAEWQLWEHVMHDEVHSKWFAPCVSISLAGSVLIMKKTTPVADKKYPKTLPNFLCDFKRGNYGMLDGQFVCHDYGTLTRMFENGLYGPHEEINWWDE